jgi:hypothetical protein
MPQPKMPRAIPIDPDGFPIDLDRPELPGGRTEYTVTEQFPDGRWFNVPTIHNGVQYDPATQWDEIMEHVRRARASGWEFPNFESLEEAEAAARRRSEAIGNVRRMKPSSQSPLGMFDSVLARMPHAELVKLRRGASPEEQARLAPFEHRAFAREWAQESPVAATVSLPFAIPAYTAAKALGLQKARSPASLGEMAHGFRGMFDAVGGVTVKNPRSFGYTCSPLQYRRGRFDAGSFPQVKIRLDG